MDDSASALERFRQQWKEEVNARARKPQGQSSKSKPERTRRTSEARLERPTNKPPTRHLVADIKDELDHYSDEDQAGESSSILAQGVEGLTIHDNIDDDEFTRRLPQKEPTSALEHFEHAVERERQGNLGDSLAHYRKAYRLDAKVDQSYRQKHFPPSKSKPTTNPSNAAATVPSTAHHSSKEPLEDPIPTAELIDSFAHCRIQGVPPVIEGDHPPPCPIEKLPTEVLLDLLQHVAIYDPAVFSRLALVCKKLAYHVWTDNSIWKRIALGSEFGLGGQQYHFMTDLQGRELVFREVGEDYDEDLPAVGESSFPKEILWRDVFHNHPRVRFTGVYISTVNYTRPGGASATAYTWNNPIHVVTYYRYLRFFRDGTCMSLLTVEEPIDVVHHLTPENLAYVRSNKKDVASSLKITPASGKSASGKTATSTSTASAAAGSSGNVAPPPAAQQIMKHVLRGRWRLCHPSLDNSAAEVTQEGIGPSDVSTLAPGDLQIETEGAGPRYRYTMHLSLKSAGRSKHMTRNNKLNWKGFWSYNLLTDDWSEFSLRHDKPFYFSRVKAYGLGY
ncbi:uncharacterized protein PV06_03192 [Exophiala oligosperma]|uniref:F-box domain-containing protein n=2 Tax=Chaetothyriales TaxID=34395 RepID=A0A0D2C4L9_9EURO|nr:uncharacterized protein PV06_03192 [Exophiala oligosperma]KAJ9642246.1 hypothetical protein H2204_002615 [Knufia peltigerae]KIW44742.1 hypothetical protein PV06_03192 [Exophiala oligosperma]